MPFKGHDAAARIVGVSPIALGLRAEARRLSRTDSPVLLIGEAGAGKTHFAETVHRLSSRSKGPFITVSAEELERDALAALFHETDGACLRADGGTLCIESFWHLPPEVQLPLYWVLRSKKFVPLGGDREVQVRFRLMTGRTPIPPPALLWRPFRTDFLEALSEELVVISGLDVRLEDIPVLAGHFLGASLSRPAELRLQLMDWPRHVAGLREHVVSDVESLVHRGEAG